MPLLSAAELAQLIAAGEDRGHDLVVLDCRFVLSDSEAGVAAYLEGHIPGAVYAHLDRDLSGPPSSDHGRHPLPPPARLADVFGQFGIGAGTRVVAYDDSFGMVAARAWWMLRYMGHAAVSVLDGGWQAWVAAGYSTTSGSQTNPTQQFVGAADRARLVCVDEVAHAAMLLDAREAPRYRGEVEPIDPSAGHIPSARNHCWRKQSGRRWLPVTGGRTARGATRQPRRAGDDGSHTLLRLGRLGLS